MTGAPASHSIITPECRASRGDEGAWTEAVARAKAEYDAIVAGWFQQPVQPVLHLTLGIERPFMPFGEWVEVRVCEHGKPVIGAPCAECRSQGGPAGDSRD